MTDTNHQADVLVIGAGIAGASLAAELAGNARVIVLEREAQPGYHTTGRSAAIYSQVYGPPQIRALSRASAGFFDAPPAGFSTHPLLRKRVVALVGRQDQAHTVAATFEEVRDRGDVGLIEGDAVQDRIPLLRHGYAAAALLENSAADIDVHALHHGYLRRLKEAGGTLVTNAEVRALGRVGGDWQVETGSGTYRAPIIVNAAGAWADDIARQSGIAPVGLVPKRRTALIVDGPERGVDDAWPMVVDIDEEFYLKPDAGRLLISPADETPSPPCDAQPEELDIAICIDRIERAFDLQVRHVANRWAGLRSFVADKVPVVGFAADAPGFFWLAGQGGYGIQSAPAMARLAAALIAARGVPDDLAAQGVDAESLSPQRPAIQDKVVK
ncbi:FAD-dependent oxidoreductase [Mesorhizobium sp. CAU 1741]|uniref:NAD(P)/FAD-dependent oxidoreductase n=1 Tax=Mesorhizobium sp. CAU 1741 TaxID=3140366 RepID=UPI00325C142D